jgi:hypothetical protein
MVVIIKLSTSVCIDQIAYHGQTVILRIDNTMETTLTGRGRLCFPRHKKDNCCFLKSYLFMIKAWCIYSPIILVSNIVRKSSIFVHVNPRSFSSFWCLIKLHSQSWQFIAVLRYQRQCWRIAVTASVDRWWVYLKVNLVFFFLVYHWRYWKSWFFAVWVLLPCLLYHITSTSLTKYWEGSDPLQGYFHSFLSKSICIFYAVFNFTMFIIGRIKVLLKKKPNHTHVPRKRWYLVIGFWRSLWILYQANISVTMSLL